MRWSLTLVLFCLSLLIINAISSCTCFSICFLWKNKFQFSIFIRDYLYTVAFPEYLTHCDCFGLKLFYTSHLHFYYYYIWAVYFCFLRLVTCISSYCSTGHSVAIINWSLWGSVSAGKKEAGEMRNIKWCWRSAFVSLHDF